MASDRWSRYTPGREDIKQKPKQIEKKFSIENKKKYLKVEMG